MPLVTNTCVPTRVSAASVKLQSMRYHQETATTEGRTPQSDSVDTVLSWFLALTYQERICVKFG